MTSGRLRSKAGGSVNVSLSGAPGARVMVPPAGGRQAGDTCADGHGDPCTARRIGITAREGSPSVTYPK